MLVCQACTLHEIIASCQATSNAQHFTFDTTKASDAACVFICACTLQAVTAGACLPVGQPSLPLSTFPLQRPTPSLLPASGRGRCVVMCLSSLGDVPLLCP